MPPNFLSAAALLAAAYIASLPTWASLGCGLIAAADVLMGALFLIQKRL
jgi:hypothetical protein